MSPCKTIGGAQRVVVKPAALRVLRERNGVAGSIAIQSAQYSSAHPNTTDYPRCQQVLGGAEGPLDAPELLVAQHRRQRREIGVGAQHEEAVEAGIVISFGAVDGEVAFARDLEEAAITGVANQCLVALAKLPPQCGDDALPHLIARSVALHDLQVDAPLRLLTAEIHVRLVWYAQIDA